MFRCVGLQLYQQQSYSWMPFLRYAEQLWVQRSYNTRKYRAHVPRVSQYSFVPHQKLEFPPNSPFSTILNSCWCCLLFPARCACGHHFFFLKTSRKSFMRRICRRQHPARRSAVGKCTWEQSSLQGLERCTSLWCWEARCVGPPPF